MLGRSYSGSYATPSHDQQAGQENQCKRIASSELLCWGKIIIFTHFQNLGWNSVNDGRLDKVEIKTKQMEAGKTREEAEVMNWERRNCKGQRIRKVSGDWTRQKMARVKISHWHPCCCA